MRSLKQKLTKKHISEYIHIKGKVYLDIFRGFKFQPLDFFRVKKSLSYKEFYLFRRLCKEYESHEQQLAKNPDDRYKADPDKHHCDINIIEGARLEILWGNCRSQILEKKIPENINSDLFTKNRIDALNNEDIVNTFYIVTPSFNSVEYIDATILSVVTQEGDFFINYHIQDGGSTDGTLKKLEKWRTLLTESKELFVKCKGVNFSFSSTHDNGMYDAINQGFQKLKPHPHGVCAWINSDDVIYGGAFSTAHSVFKSDMSVYWILGAVNGCNQNLENKSIIPLLYPREIISKGLCEHQHWQFIQQEGTFWRGQLWSKVNGVNSDLKLAGDWDLWRRFAQFVEPTHILWPLGKFRIHSNQLTNDGIKNYYKEIDSIISEQERDLSAEQLKRSIFSEIKGVKLPEGEEITCSKIPLSREYTRPLPKNTNFYYRLLNNIEIENKKNKALKVLTLNTISHGGAGTGSMRRIEALREIGVDVKLLSLISKTEKDFVGRIIPTLDAIDSKNQHSVWRAILRNIKQNITHLPGFKGQEFFSLTDSVLDMRQINELINNVDVVHLHWVVGMLDYHNIAEVIGNKPIVWTTADMNPFTGGCHYSEGCDGFTRDCSDCPMVGGETDLPHQAWKLKKSVYEHLNINVVCPSEYIANLARKSSLLGNKPIHVIPNAYPVDRLKPVDKIEARKKLNLPLDKKIVMIASETLGNLRKGSDLFVKVAEKLTNKVHINEVEFITVGKGHIALPFKVRRLGMLDEKKLVQAYSSADVYMSLSREDVGPMTVVESLLCGTPVVGFGIGVLPEVILHKTTGYCAEPFKLNQIVEGLTWFLDPKDSSDSIVKTCRETAVRYADSKLSATRHKKLYDNLVNK